MSNNSLQFVIAVFDSEAGAEETLSELKAEQKENLQGVQAAVAMRKDADNHIHYKDVGMTPAKGAVAGVVMGAIVGIATGGAGLVLGAAGALLGGVIGNRKREGRIAAEQINQVVGSIPPASSALLTIVDENAAAGFEELLQATSANTFSADLSADLTAKLNEHGDSAHEALMEQLNS